MQIRPQKKFCEQNQNKSQKTQNFMLISERLKKWQKNALTKSYKETNLMNTSKSGKSKFFHHIFANSFLCMNFFATFSTVLKSA